MAKIDIRENRAEMPERRNVLRKVISPAVAEVAVEIRTETPEVHDLKVKVYLRKEERKFLLQLKGKWMREAGIVEDSYVSVTVMEGVLLIRRVRSKVG